METYRGRLAKCNGKENAFKLWLDEKGWKQFYRQEGHPFSPRNEKDKVIIDKMYKSLSPQELQAYKDKEKSDHNSYEKKAKRRYAAESKRRAMASENPHHEHEARTEYREQLDRTNTTRVNPPVANLSPLEPCVKPNPLYAHDMKLIIKDRLEQVALQFRDYSVEQMYDLTLTLVGVSVSYVYKDVNKVQMQTVPCELSMTNFSLRGGIKNSTSVHLNMHGLMVVEPHPMMSQEDMEEIYQRARDNRAYYAMEEKTEPIAAVDPIREAWRTFKEAWAYNGQTRSILLCEKEIYNQVMASLRILAKYCEGDKETEFYNKYIDCAILPIEYLPLAMRDAAVMQIPDERMLEYFMEPVIPNSEAYYCPEYHGKLPSNNTKRWICQQARGAMAIHKFFKTMQYENIYGFGLRFDETIHIVCRKATDKEKNLIPKLNPDTFIEFNPRALNNKRAIQSWALPASQKEHPVAMGSWAPPDPNHASSPRSDNSGSDSDISDVVIRGKFLKDESDFVMLDPIIDEEHNIRWPSSSSSKAERSPTVQRRYPSFKEKENNSKWEKKQDEIRESGIQRNWARDPGAWRNPDTAPDGGASRGHLPQEKPGNSGQRNPTNWGGISPEPYAKQPAGWPTVHHNRWSRPSNRNWAPVTKGKLELFDEEKKSYRGPNVPPSGFLPPNVREPPGFLPHLPSYASACPSRAGSRMASPSSSRRSYDANDRIACNLHNVLISSDEETDREVNAICDRAADMDLRAPPRRKLRPKPKPQPRPAPVPRNPAPIQPPWPTFRWRIILDKEIRSMPLWCSKEGAAYNPFG